MVEVSGRSGSADSASRARRALLVANGVGILAASGFAAAGVHRPTYVAADEQGTDLARFWAASSAVRTWAIAGPLLVSLTRPASTARSSLLLVAGLVQLGDAALGAQRRDPAMATAPAVMGLVHLVSAFVL